VAQDGWTREKSPFHAGERAIQERIGVRERLERQGRQMVRAFLPAQHRAFYAGLPWLLVASADAQGRPWCSALCGGPGFLPSPDPGHLRVGALPHAGDPLSGNLALGAYLGLLGLDPATRRRNRLNGRVIAVDHDGFLVAVDQAFGNCPQYIQAREPAPAELQPWPGPAETLGALDGPAMDLIARADTFFVATRAEPAGDDPATAGLDASHRGGRPGFVRVEAEQQTLLIPDFSGNLHFNTLGNLLLDPRAGLLFPDFETGELLHVTGEAEIIWDGPQVLAFRGAERLWRFRVSEGVRRPGALPLRWALVEPSPNLDATGTWAEADAALSRLQSGPETAGGPEQNAWGDGAARATARLHDTWRPHRVERIVRESEAVISLHLVPADGGILPAWQAGQALPIRLQVPDRTEPVVRTYSVSSAPSDGMLRISVKREAMTGPDAPPSLASGFLHDGVREGDLIEALAPRGAFTFDAAQVRPAVLLSAGIGITPMVAMLRHAAVEGRRTRRFRPLWFFHVARDGRDRAFFDEVMTLAAEMPEEAIRLHFALTRPGRRDLPGRDYQSFGRLGTDLLQRLMPFGGYEFYLCGPASFVQDLYAGLRALDVPDALIHAEAFGPSSLARRPDGAAAVPSLMPAAAGPVTVEFSETGRTAVWRPGEGSLLDLAEAAGLAPTYGCRAGVCGACAVPVLAGEVAYAVPPSAAVSADHALLCCSVPAMGTPLKLDL